MVRLVFRPYTQVWASICTSERLRTSTRVSSGFILLGHSSPSFGSQHSRSITSRSFTKEDWSDGGAYKYSRQGRRILVWIWRNSRFYFHCALGFSTQALAWMLDSLVRVSRRVEWSPSVRNFTQITLLNMYGKTLKTPEILFLAMFCLFFF